MDNTTVTSENQTQQTTNYDQFVLLSNNRDPNRGHIEALKRAFDENGNFTRVQPILVNERMQIIDGQHRFVACKELGQPIFYTVVPGLGIGEARQMNLLHRQWNADDYAKSYADGGNRHYVEYLKLKEDYGYSHSVLLAFADFNPAEKGRFARFRAGELTIAHTPSVRERLDQLKDVESIVGHLAKDGVFALAFYKISSSEVYDHKRMLKKLEQQKNDLKRYSNMGDALRQFEDVYNFMYSDTNRARLY